MMVNSNPRRPFFLGLLDLVLSGLQFLRWPSTVILEGHLTNSHKNREVPRQICCLIQRLCFGAPRHVQIDGHHSLEVQPWDGQRSLGLNRLCEPFSTANLHYFWSTNYPHFVFRPCELIQSFVMILDPSGFNRERIVMKQQSRSLAGQSWEGLLK